MIFSAVSLADLPLGSLLTMLICSLFAFFMTTAGAFTVIFFRKLNEKLMAALLGFGAGVMMAASIWSLLVPAIEMTTDLLGFFLHVVLGFFVGGLVIVMGDYFLNRKMEQSGKTNYSLKSCIIVIFAITLHNIPEGMCIGVAFGASSVSGTTAAGAIALALSIALQNFPEGAAVSMPLYSNGIRKSRALLAGSLSGIVEPIAALAGYYLSVHIQGILPFLLATAAGAMIITTVRELIPDSCDRSKNFATFGFLIGFLLMMAMDTLIG